MLQSSIMGLMWMFISLLQYFRVVIPTNFMKVGYSSYKISLSLSTEMILLGKIGECTFFGWLQAKVKFIVCRFDVVLTV